MIHLQMTQRPRSRSTELILIIFIKAPQTGHLFNQRCCVLAEQLLQHILGGARGNTHPNPVSLSPSEFFPALAFIAKKLFETEINR